MKKFYVFLATNLRGVSWSPRDVCLHDTYLHYQRYSRSLTSGFIFFTAVFKIQDDVKLFDTWCWASHEPSLYVGQHANIFIMSQEDHSEPIAVTRKLTRLADWISSLPQHMFMEGKRQTWPRSWRHTLMDKTVRRTCVEIFKSRINFEDALQIYSPKWNKKCRLKKSLF